MTDESIDDGVEVLIQFRAEHSITIIFSCYSSEAFDQADS